MSAPADCQKCSLHKSRLVVVNSTLPESAEVLIVGEAPGRHEEDERKGFVGDAGQYLRDKLREVGFKPHKLAYANAVRCRPPVSPKKKQRAPTSKQISECNDFLAEDVKRLPNLKLILALGRSAIEAVHRSGAGVGECMGPSFVCDRFDVPTIAAYHPSAVMQGHQEESAFVGSLRRAKEFIDGVPELGLGEYLVIAPGEGYTEAEALRGLEDLRDLLLASKRFAFDLETDGLDPRTVTVFCASFSCREHEGYVVPLLGRYVECEGQTLEEVTQVLGDGGRTPRQIWSPKALTRVKELLEEILTCDVDKEAQNGVYDVECARFNLGIEVRRFTYDMMLAHHVGIKERPPHNLEVLRAEFTSMPPYDMELKRWAPTKMHKFVAAPDDVLWQYSGADADCEFRIAGATLKEMRRQEHEYAEIGAHSEWLLHEIIMPLQRALSYTSERGVPLNMELLDRLAHELVSGRDELEIIMNDALAKLDIEPPKNWDSWQQLAKIMYGPAALAEFYCKCGKPFQTDKNLRVHCDTRKHDVGAPPLRGMGLPERDPESAEAQLGLTLRPTDAEIIGVMLSGRDANGKVVKLGKHRTTVLKHLLRHKYYGKMRGTFVGDEERTKGWPKHVKDYWEDRGLVHSHFHIPGTETGRLSSSKPNVQNPPRDVVFRNVVRPPKGFWIIDADYSQVENRVMAYGAMCEQYLIDLLTCTCGKPFESTREGIDAFEKHVKGSGHGRLDMHTGSAMRIYKATIDQVTKEMRAKAKRFVHGANYGIGAWTIAHRFNISQDQAQAELDGYFNIYPELLEYQKKTIPRLLRHHGAVSNVFGRVRRFPDYNAVRTYAKSGRDKDKPARIRDIRHARGLVNHIKREAISTFPQASAADLLHLATVGLGDWRGVEEYGSDVMIHRLLKDRLGEYPALTFRHEYDAYLGISMHDSLVAFVPEKYLEKAKELMCQVMFETPLLAIPEHQRICGPHPVYGEWPEGWYLPVEAKVRERWGTDNRLDGDKSRLGDDEEIGAEYMEPGSTMMPGLWAKAHKG